MRRYQMTLGTIEQEAADCRKAFEGIEVGAPVWCCHHSKLAEALEEPAENRISYILSAKDVRERALRLKEFRPIKGVGRYADYKAKLAPLYADYEAKLAPLYADYKAKLAALYADYEAKLAALYADYKAKLAALYADYEAKLAALYADVMALHMEECPDTTWTERGIAI
jgi:hypothetical protein